MHPEWIHKAQKKIDDIVGPDRLPSFADRPRLPYIEAVMRGQFILLFADHHSRYSLATETLRWRPGGRFGFPHQSTADDTVEYNGEQYFIPAGSTVFGVTWSVPVHFRLLGRDIPEYDLLGQLNMTRPDTQTPTPSTRTGFWMTWANCAQTTRRAHLASVAGVRIVYSSV